MLFANKKTTAKRVLVVELVARIELDPVRDNVAIHARSDAVENQITNIIRPKQDGAVASEDGRLHAEIVHFLLIGEDRVGGLFGLVLVEF